MSGPRPAFSRIAGSRPVAAACLVMVNALLLGLIVVGNLTDYGTNLAYVRHVLSMDTTGGDPDVMWRAIDVPALWHTAYIGIIVWEAAATLALVAALVFYVRGWTDGGLDRARGWASIGLVMVVLLFGCGFIAVGGEWFQMWRSADWNGVEPAFRNVVLAVLGLILVHLPDAGRNASGSQSGSTI
ncbi:DUF2165 domain-containing protein [Gordonia sp. (in: high G+C Gram-positive bacteria)]|uniref:DUF2165 domain-containing protein n=1 Tax=Gordonia sp. (in: high G+C Gram-positive bacteria) TaxID=84139 RepID=UPI0039E33C34